MYSEMSPKEISIFYFFCNADVSHSKGALTWQSAVKFYKQVTGF